VAFALDADAHIKREHSAAQLRKGELATLVSVEDLGNDADGG
jgi:hypothetical protein